MSTEEFWFDVNSPFEETQNWRTLVTRYEDGKEQRRNKWSQPKRGYVITLRGRTDTVMDQVWDFYTARSGAYDTFYFENTNESPISAGALGNGDGTTTVFTSPNFPYMSGSPTAIMYNGTTIDSSNYTVARSTGAITFTIAASGGTIITQDYSFARIVRFKEDSLARELFNFKLYNSGMEFIEVL